MMIAFQESGLDQIDQNVDVATYGLGIGAGLMGRICQGLRDFRAGELRLLMVAVMLAVAALSAVGFFADRLNSGLSRDARQLLGGDAIVASDHPAPQAIVDKARELGLPVLFAGVGEKMEDILPFDAENFVDSLLD